MNITYIFTYLCTYVVEKNKSYLNAMLVVVHSHATAQQHPSHILITFIRARQSPFDLAVQLKSMYMSLQIVELGEEYLMAAMLVQNTSREMLSAFRKANDKQIKKKQSKAHPSFVSAFIKK